MRTNNPSPGNTPVAEQSRQAPEDRGSRGEAQANMPSMAQAARRRAACPEILDPQALVDAIRDDDWTTAIDGGLARCRECGECDTVAPSTEPLLPWLRFGKGELAWREHEHARAQLSRQRHLAREHRLEHKAQARAERLKARELPTPAPPTSAQPALPPAVAAALARARQRNTPTD